MGHKRDIVSEYTLFCLLHTDTVLSPGEVGVVGYKWSYEQMVGTQWENNEQVRGSSSVYGAPSVVSTAKQMLTSSGRNDLLQSSYHTKRNYSFVRLVRDAIYSYYSPRQLAVESEFRLQREGEMSTTQLSIRHWTTKHVAKWLKDEGFCHYVDLLCNKHRLDGMSLLTLSEYDLRSPPLELKVLGDIKRLMVSLRKLQKQNLDILEELGVPFDGHSPQGGDWHCNGDSSRECDNSNTDTAPVGEQYLQYRNGKYKHGGSGRLDPEYWKTVLSAIYVVFVFGFTSFVMVIVHERVPDMRTYPPLPDIFLDSVPRIPWAFAMAEACGVILCNIWLLVLLLHKHRSILLRRLCSLMGTVFMLRCITMFVTSLSVPGQHLQCSGKVYGDMWAKLHRALAIWSGFGMSLTGVHTCGDYMFSGHTVVITMLNFFVTEYTPRGWNFLHTLSWVLNLFGIFFILAAHEHYSIDVFIAFYITTRLFLYYHTLANTRAYQQSRRARIWFPMFSFFECNVNGPVPNEYGWPFSKPAMIRSMIGY